jgi:hypothetical protein
LDTVDAIWQFLNTWGLALGIVGSIIGIFVGGLQAGKYLERQRKRVDRGLNELNSRIRWIDETTRDIRGRITPDISLEVERAYQGLIDDLQDDRYKLQLVVDSVAEQELRQRQRS